ncbi:hypothetical protein HUJ05_005329 [Dendroctonus ponderosae]|nr:hypothetical protein HUJ05_005329 [Dendroctonus ponderosae]
MQGFAPYRGSKHFCDIFVLLKNKFIVSFFKIHCHSPDILPSMAILWEEWQTFFQECRNTLLVVCIRDTLVAVEGKAMQKIPRALRLSDTQIRSCFAVEEDK